MVEGVDAFSTGSVLALPNWGTPAPLFQVWHREYRFDLDVCAEPWNHKLPRYFSLVDGVDGLKASWKGARVWCNPPYSDVRPWLEKGVEHAMAGGFSAFLVPANISTTWFHDLAMLGQVHLFRGRIQFEIPPESRALLKGKGKSSTIANALVVYDMTSPRSGVVATRSAKTGERIS